MKIIRRIIPLFNSGRIYITRFPFHKEDIFTTMTINSKWQKSPACKTLQNISVYHNAEHPKAQIATLDVVESTHDKWVCTYDDKKLSAFRAVNDAVEWMDNWLDKNVEKKLKKFWFVFRDSEDPRFGMNKPARELVRQVNYETARSEAMRLSRSNPGERFIVMCSAGACDNGKTVEIVT